MAEVMVRLGLPEVQSIALFGTPGSLIGSASSPRGEERGSFADEE